MSGTSTPIVNNQINNNNQSNNNNNNNQNGNNSPNIQPVDDAEEKRFISNLFYFMTQRGTPIEKIPIFDHKELNLYKLYNCVISRGGLEAVIENKLWRQITTDLAVDPERTDAGFRLRIHYLKYLYPYERKHYLKIEDDELFDYEAFEKQLSKSPADKKTSLSRKKKQQLQNHYNHPSNHQQQQQQQHQQQLPPGHHQSLHQHIPHTPSHHISHHHHHHHNNNNNNNNNIGTSNNINIINNNNNHLNSHHSIGKNSPSPSSSPSSSPHNHQILSPPPQQQQQSLQQHSHQPQQQSLSNFNSIINNNSTSSSIPSPSHSNVYDSFSNNDSILSLYNPTSFSTTPYNTSPAVNLKLLEIKSLKKYNAYHRLKVSHSPSRTELVSAVIQHFSHQNIDEDTIITSFLKRVKSESRIRQLEKV